MVELSRSVRFSVALGGPSEAGQSGRNTFAGWPTMTGLGAYYQLDVTCRGEADSTTGYLLNISEIDGAVRRHALPLIVAAVRTSPSVHPASLLPAVLDALREPLKGLLASVSWRLTPYYSVAMTVDQSDQFVLTEVFEFAAAHRLNCGALSPEENRALFGKCNNASGHGHNYRVEVSVVAPLTMPATAESIDHSFSSLQLERIVDETVVQRFDHKNLDVDTEEFAAINSSVENIAKVCFDLLEPEVAAAGAKLRRVRVWETEKTSSTYPA